MMSSTASFAIADSSKSREAPRYISEPSTVVGLVAMGGISYGTKISFLSLKSTLSESLPSRAARREAAPDATEDSTDESNVDWNVMV